MEKQEYTEKLVHCYKDTFEKDKKEWWPSKRYFPTYPTIPWIGDHYDEHRILIYASAENLSDSYIGNNKPLFKTEKAFNRHARFWEKKREIGIAPFDTGGLRLVGIMCLQKRGFEVPENGDVASYIAVANISKFSLLQRNGKNVDVKTKRDMKPSCSYLQIDLEVLKPSLIVNASGKRGKWLKKIFKEFAPDLDVIDLYQYTKTQLGFYHLQRKKGLDDEEVAEFRPKLTNLIEKYSSQLRVDKEKVSNDDFVRYFYLVQQRLVHKDY